MLHFVFGATMFALGAFVFRAAMTTQQSRQSFWFSYLRNMGYGLCMSAGVYLMFQELLSVKNVPGVIASGVSAAVMWFFAVKREFNLITLVEDIGRIGRIAWTYSLLRFVATQDSSQLYIVAAGGSLLLISILVMNRIAPNAPSANGTDTDGSAGN